MHTKPTGSPTLGSRPSRTRPPAPRCFGPTRLRCFRCFALRYPVAQRLASVACFADVSFQKLASQKPTGSPTLGSRPSRTRPPAPRCFGPTPLPPWQPHRYQARRHYPLLPGSQGLYWRSRLCPRLADPRQCRVYCRGRYQPQSLLRCQLLLHRAPQVSCRHWRPGAFIPTEQPTPVARYRRLRRAGCRRPCRHYRLTDADAHAVAAAVFGAFANTDEKVDTAAQSRAHASAKPCAHQASKPAAHRPAHASAETDGVLPSADAAPPSFPARPLLRPRAHAAANTLPVTGTVAVAHGPRERLPARPPHCLV